MARIPGPTDQIRNYQNIIDGTLARQPSPLPGPVGLNRSDLFLRYPSVFDQFGGSSSPFHQEAWFEERIPNLLRHELYDFVQYVNLWVKKHPKKNIFDGKTLRELVSKSGQ